MAARAAKQKPLDEVISDSYLFKGSHDDVKRCVQTLQSDRFPQPKFRKILQYVLEAMQSQSLSDELKEAIEQDAELSTLFIGLHYIIDSTIRSRSKDKDITTLLRELALPQAFAEDIARALTVSRESLESKAAELRISYPSVSRLRWRTDVTISTTSLERVFRPTVLMQMTLDTGRIVQFECSPEKFQKLRFQTAMVLKNMQELSKHPTLILNAEQQ
eukprot:TRINITY_DN13349_c0_g1_i2.p1 TRINITY_DN13349_c0_g1~~TRINITY_DN13349_c0_g1_i2.p1  ORF type:complete len:217 (+),score=63.76 TRINITY_DN13349_c0_g1_i2:58-708(+)